MNISLAEFVRERAYQCCEYCRMPQIYEELPFEIDHVVAEQHGGKTIVSNLALACFADNHHKGPNLAGIDPKTRKRTWLFNPRRHRWVATSAGTGRSWSGWLLGLAHPARMKEKFPETPMKQRLILSGSMSLKRLGTFDESPRLRDQCVVFQTTHSFPKLAVPSLPLEQWVVGRRAAQFVPEFGRTALVGKTLSNRSEALNIAVE